MKVQNNIVVRTAHDIGEGFVEIAKETWGFFGHPSQWRPRIEAAKQRRQDTALQAHLNRQIRRQFIEAFNRSAQKKMTVETAGIMRQYKTRNGFISALLRPYEKYASWRLSAKVIGASVFFRAARKLLYPLMGAWGMIVPLAAFVGSRMAIVYREAKNKQQETQLAREGFIVPCTFDVKDNAVSVLGREMNQNFTAGFPVMHTKTPEWVVAQYDAARKDLEKPQALHAAGFEALRAGALTWDDVTTIRAAFPQQEARQGCVYAFSLLFPGATADSLIADVRKMAEEHMPAPKSAAPVDRSASATFRRISEAKPEDKSLPAIALAALAPFCVTGKEDTGLSVLAGKCSPDDVRYLAGLQMLETAPDRAQAASIMRMIRDPRFAPLSFRDMTEVALASPAVSTAFDELWKDREYRTRFGFDFLHDVAFNINGWGAVALRITRHDYANALSAAEIRELSAPENETWAPTYHRVRVAQPETTGALSHEELKSLVQEYGIKAGDVLAAKNTLKLETATIPYRIAPVPSYTH